ncbi:phosphoribosyltransferase-like protein [Vibrio cincinnatiensis]|uniref:phosphoribosyltransferase-like protein n=1 Tax=Vibrio cincinnatiensis TaxID=675 RepID=UPI001EDC9AA2|nr:hypothetical protein [Vibrio cincinnatiensis]MCG3727581.1 hypothetical protein [Vibrio cincinnatiensis]
MESILSYLEDYENLPEDLSVEEHYKKWLAQFDTFYHEAITETLDSLLEHFYVTKSYLSESMKIAVTDDKVTRERPKKHWKHSYILNCQKNGASQNLLSNMLTEHLDIRDFAYSDSLDDCKRFVYVDDFSFTYGRVRQDLAALSKIYPGAYVDVVIPVTYSYNYYNFKRKNDLDLNLTVLFRKMIENKVYHKNVSDVFWPHIDSLGNEDFREAIECYGFDTDKLRTKHIETKFFRDPQARYLAEEAFTIYGARILASLQDKKNFKPLGISPYNNSLGFGAACFSYRNCPNTTPLVFWWGSYDDECGTALQWYPLTKRKGYN